MKRKFFKIERQFADFFQLCYYARNKAFNFAKHQTWTQPFFNAPGLLFKSNNSSWSMTLCMRSWLLWKLCLFFCTPTSTCRRKIIKKQKKKLWRCECSFFAALCANIICFCHQSLILAKWQQSKKGVKVAKNQADNSHPVHLASAGNSGKTTH